MKSFILALTVFAVSMPAYAFNDHIVSGDTGAATAQQELVCKSAPSQYGGIVSITIPSHDEYTATLRGFVTGGMAHFIRLIGPMNVKISHEADSVLYANDEEGVELFVTTTAFGGELHTVATLKEGSSSTSLNCKLQ